MNQSGKKCIIISAGEFDMDFIETVPGDYIIAADGGYRHCLGIGLQPDLILGDFDSIDPESRGELTAYTAQHPGCVQILPAEKDDTDTLAAIRIGLARGCREFEIYGSQGGRLSHTMANIQSLFFLKQNGANGSLIGKTNRVFLIQNETLRLPDSWKGYLSLFSYGEQAEGVTLQNLRYELQDAVLTNSFPIGVSNELTERPAVVSVRKGTLLAVYEHFVLGQ